MSNEYAALGFALMLSVVFYHYMMLAFADTILENPKLKKAFRLPMALFNAIVIIALSLSNSNSLSVNIFMLALLTLEFSLFYKDRFTRIFFVVSAYLLHIMAVRAIVVALMSWMLHITYFEVVNVNETLLLSTTILFTTLGLAVLAVKTLIPVENIKIINRNDEQFWFLCMWTTVCNIYLIFNSLTYSVDETYALLNYSQVLTPLAILVALYIVLFYAMKINQLLGYKEKSRLLEMEVQREHKYRDSIMSDAIASYEFDLDCYEFTAGFEEYEKGGRSLIKNYDEMLAFLVEQRVYPEDRSMVLNIASAENIIREFDSGKSQISIEFRDLMPDGDYRWVRSICNIVEEETTGGLKGFVYIKDIDKDKKKQLDLQFKAERDSLTGLYNKGMTKKLISEYLQIHSGTGLSSALLIVDVDNFKNVNDKLGHTFGDTVLCELAERLKKLFRDKDILGRIGGDEFVVFLIDIKDSEIIKKKAQEICSSFVHTYTTENNEAVQISSSVGVAISPGHGTTYEHLFRNADIAMYAAKNRGKGTYEIYEGQEFSEYSNANRTEIDSAQKYQKDFKSNRIEYVFKILYDSESPLTAIQSVLRLITEHFNFSRGYIFEHDSNGVISCNTFEWCNHDISPELPNLQRVPLGLLSLATKAFHETGRMIVPTVSALSKEERAILEPQGIRSMLQFPMFEQGEVVGFIGFDDCVDERIPSVAEIDEMATICGILATFVNKQRTMERMQNNTTLLLDIMSGLDSLTYVVNKETYEVLFFNASATAMGLELKTGDICYRAIRNREQPCKDCPMLKLAKDSHAKASQVFMNDKNQRWTEATASHIQWINGEIECLISCTDVSRYKESKTHEPSEEEAFFEK